VNEGHIFSLSDLRAFAFSLEGFATLSPDSYLVLRKRPPFSRFETPFLHLPRPRLCSPPVTQSRQLRALQFATHKGETTWRALTVVLTREKYALSPP